MPTTTAFAKSIPVAASRPTAGTGGTGLGGGGFADGRALTDAKFNLPTGLAIDADGNVYVADQRNNRIRKIDKSGNVTTVAGGEGGYQDGSATAARFNHPTALAVDATGNIYVADTDNQLIRKISPDGAVKAIAGTVAGGTGVPGHDGRPPLAARSSTFRPGSRWMAQEPSMWPTNRNASVIAPDGTVAAQAGRKEGYAEGAGAAAHSTSQRHGARWKRQPLRRGQFEQPDTEIEPEVRRSAAERRRSTSATKASPVTCMAGTPF